MQYSDYSGNLITRICYEFFVFPQWNLGTDEPPSIFACIKMFLKKCFSCLVHWDKKAPPVKPVVFFSTTLNNSRALKPVWTLLNEDSYALWLDDFIFSESKISFWSLCYILSFIKMYVSLNASERKIVRKYYFWFMNAYGHYKTIGSFIKKNRNVIKAVVMANDCSPTNICIIENCKKYGVKVLYVQHASIVEWLPQNRFDYSFLDGVDSYRKYLAIGKIQGQAILSGGTRFDALSSNGGHDYVGIAINQLDNVQKVLDLCSYLSKNGFKNILLRPHPRLDLTGDDKEAMKTMGICISNPKEETPFSFISRLFILIANESGIHLEAALGQVPAVMFNFSDLELNDYYSYVKKGISKRCDTFEGVLRECQSPQLISKSVVRDYNAAFGTAFEGKVSEMVAAFISKLINNENADEYINSIFNYNNDGYYEYKQL